jgi:hypothetical protein
MRKTQTKVFNFREDIEHLKEKMNVDTVWIDFGKQNTKIEYYQCDENEGDGELNFKGHQIYFIMPPDIELMPSNVIIFELIYLSSKDSSEDICMGWGAFPMVNGDF